MCSLTSFNLCIHSQTKRLGYMKVQYSDQTHTHTCQILDYSQYGQCIGYISHKYVTSSQTKKFRVFVILSILKLSIKCFSYTLRKQSPTFHKIPVDKFDICLSVDSVISFHLKVDSNLAKIACFPQEYHCMPSWFVCPI